MKLTKLNQLIVDGEIVRGHWELTPDHELQYRRDGLDEEIKLKGALIAAEPDGLVFSVTERQSDQEIVTSLGKLTGTWGLNPANQILFEVEKESGRNDVLTFRGAWKVDDNREVVYGYRQTGLKTKTKQTQELVFKGHWDISGKHRLTYYLGTDSGSAFRFRGAFQTKSILAKKGEIRYQVGVEAGGRRRIQTIILFGRWVVSRDLNLSFELATADGRKTITFGGEYSLDNVRRVTVNLRSAQGDPLGIELILTKDIFQGDGQTFVKLQKSLEESSIEAGVSFRW